jgi:ABC-type uncharacterized transport system substrate-binding protein
MTGVSDAVELGFVAALARPGGNITGISVLARSAIDDFGICERLTDSFHSCVCVSGRAKSVTFLQTIS